MTGNGSLIVTDTLIRYTQVPGLSANVTVSPGSDGAALIETDGGVQLNSFDPIAACIVDVAVFVDGTQVGSGRRVPVYNNATVVYSVGSYGFSVQTTLAPGTHTISVMAKRFLSTIAECYVSSVESGSGLPGNPRLQGILNIIASSR